MDTQKVRSMRAKCTDLETEADELLKESSDGERTYTERQLARKIRTQDQQTPLVDDSAASIEGKQYLIRRQLLEAVQSAHLTRLQAVVVGLWLRGFSASDIAEKYEMKSNSVSKVLKRAQRRIANICSPYDGLYEVYWSEVNRCIYRKR